VSVEASNRDDASALIGQTLQHRYRILSEMGRGGMGAVYLADDRRLARRVVVKVPHARLMEKASTRKRFFSEIEQQSRHEHPHIVRIQDFGEHEGCPYAVLQYVDGGNLADRLERSAGPQTPEEILGWLRDIADALDAVHARGAVHRDVKPANILFDERGAAFLSDFGITTEMIAEIDATLAPDQHLTTTGAFIGSAPFAPPEAVERHLTAAYDQYSLGVVVYEALTRTMPFQASTAELLLIAKHTAEPMPLEASGVRVPRACARAVMRALSRRPADRFESCGAFARAFAQGVEVPGRRVRSEERSRVGAWLALSLVAAALAAGGWWSIREEVIPVGAWDSVVAAVTRTLEGAGVERAARQTPATGESAADSASPPSPEIRVERDPAADELAAAPAAAPATSREEPPALEPIGPTLFLAGSTPREIDDALALCRDHVDLCEREWYASEKARAAQIPRIEVDRTEVTNRAFADFVRASGHRSDAEERGSSYHGPIPVPGLSWRHPVRGGAEASDRPEHPVVHVSLRDAEAFCASTGGRLPSEEEWEFAARGEERRIFPWGDGWDPSRPLWRGPDAPELGPVGSHPAGDTPEGFSDLAGSVWEWTSTHTDEGQVLKGGSWREWNPANLRSAARLVMPADESSSDVGFRCVREVPQ